MKGKKGLKIFIISIIVVGCGTVATVENISEESTPETFEAFYNRFHTDTAFQLQRINFPLKGVSINGDYNPDEDTMDFYWQKDDWQMHHIPDTVGTGLKLEYETIKDTVKEMIYLPNSGYRSQRFFVLKNGKWYLDYFEDISL